MVSGTTDTLVENLVTSKFFTLSSDPLSPSSRTPKTSDPLVPLEGSEFAGKKSPETLGHVAAPGKTHPILELRLLGVLACGTRVCAETLRT